MSICARCQRPRSASRPRCVLPSSGTAIPLNDAPTLILPRLMHIEIVAVCLPIGDMKRLLHGCTTLVYLRLQMINGLSRLHITYMTLRTIYVCCWCGKKTSQDVYHGMVI